MTDMDRWRYLMDEQDKAIAAGDANRQFELSIEIARCVGVKEENILHNVEEMDAYFES